MKIRLAMDVGFGKEREVRGVHFETPINKVDCPKAATTHRAAAVEAILEHFPAKRVYSWYQTKCEWAVKWMPKVAVAALRSAGRCVPFWLHLFLIVAN